MLTTLLTLAQDTAPSANPLSGIAPIILMFVIFYFVLIRPQRKKQKELQEQINTIKIGDKVITTGGINAMVANIKERTVILKVSDNTKIEFEKIAIQSVTKKKDDSKDDSKEDPSKSNEEKGENS